MGFMDSLKAALTTNSASKLPPPPPAPPASEGRDLLPLTNEVTVVGTSYRQKELQRISGWTKSGVPEDRYHEAVIEFEPKNPHDKNAIRVAISGVTIGYISKSDHKWMAPKLRKVGGSAWAVIVLIGGRDGDNIGARLRES